ncbi:MAG: transcriptional repressor [Planctomycetota bacterium]
MPTATKSKPAKDQRLATPPSVPGHGDAIPATIPACSMFRRYLRSHGQKYTPERAAILDAVLQTEGLFEAEQLADELKSSGNRTSRATVYRTLTHLTDAGIVKQVFLGQRSAHYEVIAGRETNDYIVCVETGQVVAVPGELLKPLREKLASEHGFSALSHQFVIYGLGPEARASAGDDEQGDNQPES